MKYQVYYFSRTGNSRRVAETIAAKLSCPIYPITDDVDWTGIKGYLQFYRYSKNKKTPSLRFEGDPRDGSIIILVSPIWASGLPPTINEFIKNMDRSAIHLITTSMMETDLKEQGFCSLTKIIKSKKNEEAMIDEFAKNFLSKN